MNRILFIDHRDSFSWNLIAQIRGLGHSVSVQQSDTIEASAISDLFKDIAAIVFSPGPGHPLDYPNSLALYHAAKGRIPMMGICLGFQIILAAEGIDIGRLPEVLHGEQTLIRIDPNAVAYKGVEPALKVGRYHSLGLSISQLPEGCRATAWDVESARILSFENRDCGLYGFQFHPDSFLSSEGERIITNVLRTCLPKHADEAPVIETGNLWEQKGAFTTLRLTVQMQASAKLATLWFPRAHSQRLHRDLHDQGLAVAEPIQLLRQFISATTTAAKTLACGEWLVRWSHALPRAAIEIRPCLSGNASIQGSCLSYLRHLPQQKNLYYGELLKHLQAVDRQSTEVLLIHPDKACLLEGITCNLILLREGQFFTPADDCLPGLTLQMLASRLLPTTPIQRIDIPISSIGDYDAIAVCGTGRGIAAIEAIPGLQWQQRDSSMLALLRKAYQSLIQTAHDRIQFVID